MSLIKKIIQFSENFLSSCGIHSARLDAELMLASVLKIKRLDFFLRKEVVISTSHLMRYLSMLMRRSKREPLQYIVGTVEFYGLLLDVNSNVLIPRHETEQLIDILVDEVSGKKAARILDLGTGSGSIALSLAKKFPMSQVLGVDINPEALKIARANATRNGIYNVSFSRSDWFENIRGKFDLIVSNPPYLSEEEFSSTESEVKLFEPKSALVSQNNGLEDIFDIIRLAKQFLNPSGILAIEIGYSQYKEISQFSKKYFSSCKVFKDLCKMDRFVFLENVIFTQT